MRNFLPTLLTFEVVLDQWSGIYDYVILGGGTAGLVLANRLSEDPNVSVAVIEAGASVKNNFNVTQTENFFINLNTPIDWQYQSQPQQYTYNRILTHHSGKALGGTSTINGATYMRAQKAQIDAWEQLGNTGWNWNSLWPYYKSSEQFQPPTPQLVAKGAEYEPWAHGHDGHVRVGWSNFIQNGSAQSVLNRTVQNIGIPYNKDQSDGNVHGFSIWPSTIISSTGIRADAARNYLYSIQNRKNLHLFTGTLAEKILWEKTTPSYQHDVTASGVQVRTASGGHVRLLKVKREVIVSTGTLKSPTILENSGIGNPSILSAKQIPVVVDLPSVGENLQDQPSILINASAHSDWTGYTPFVTNPTASDLFGSNLTSVAAHVRSQIPAYASAIASQANHAVSPKAVEKQLKIQADLIFDKNTPCAELISVPSQNWIATVTWVLLPFSRGSVHLGATNATSAPLINPNFLMLDWDAIAGAAMANLVRRMYRTKPLTSFVGSEITPGTATVPASGTVNDWLPWIKQTYSPNYHPVGTCAMMSRDLGGVVDSELRVYGTANVRVVDASVFPFQIDGHLTSTIYAVAERAADIIRGRPV